MAKLRRTIRFLFRGGLIELGSIDPTMTVLDWLRLEQKRTGTKEGCNEGDCGACTVVVARPQGKWLNYRAVNSCIQFLGTLDGGQLITVEDLQSPDGRPHSVQQAMVDHHGSQCGFCTPGFVMSLFAMTKAEKPMPVDDVLAGNLCRCTGYAPIVRAAESILRKPAQDHFDAAAKRTLRQLRALQDDALIAAGGGAREFFAPAAVEDFARLARKFPDAAIIAGATDAGLWVTKQMRRPAVVISAGRINGFADVTVTRGSISIGAGATYADAAPVLAKHYPDMGEIIRRLGSLQIRNAGTIGGNIANASPIGDMAPMLIAAGATLHLRRGGRRRTMPLENFFAGYGKQNRQPGEFVERVSLRVPAKGAFFKAYKVSKRFDDDISAVLAAFNISIRHGKVLSARIAFGGMAATPKRALAAEAALIGQVWSKSAIAAAQSALAVDFTPISDARASAAYRMQAARNLLIRLFIELESPQTETRLAAPREALNA